MFGTLSILPSPTIGLLHVRFRITMAEEGESRPSTRGLARLAPPEALAHAPPTLHKLFTFRKDDETNFLQAKRIDIKHAKIQGR